MGRSHKHQWKASTTPVLASALFDRDISPDGPFVAIRLSRSIQQTALASTLCMMIFMAFFVKFMCVSFVPISVDMQMLMNHLAMQMAMLMHQI